MVTRIALMLPGAVSLGAYEGGALAALLKAVQASEGELVIDAVASASAGSITGLVATRALLCGDDPVDIMRKTWVDLPSIEHLEAGAKATSPLSMDGLLATATAILGARIDPGKRAAAQTVPVSLSMALTALGGLTYSLVQHRPESSVSEPLTASTYVDFYRATLTSSSTIEDFCAHIQGAMASGSTPVGFLPMRLDRTGEMEDYRANGIVMPAEGPLTMWFSDGGDLDNQPLGRLLDLIASIDDASEAPPDWDRVIVVLNIEPGGPPSFTGTWFGPDTPTWLSTLLHVDHIRSSQSLYDDLKTLEKTNQRIAWIKEIAGALEGRVDDTLPALAKSMADQRAAIATQVHAQSGTAPAPPTPAGTIEDLLLQAAGLEDKSEVVVHVISPEVDPHIDLSPERQLSGEFLFHFGGFFDEKFRESDFSLGYRNTQYWLERWLAGRFGRAGAMLAAVKDGFEGLPWSQAIDQGSASVSSLSLSEKLRAVKLFGHIEHVVAHDMAIDVVRHFEDGEGGEPHQSIKDIVEGHLRSLLRSQPHEP